MKKSLLFLLPILFFALIYSLQFTKIRIKEPFDLNKSLKAKASKEYLEQNIAVELKNKNFEEAKALIDLAKYLNVDINASLINEYNEQNSGIEGFINKSEDFFKGFISGKANSMPSLAGSVSSDFTLVGDVRDVYREGGKYLEGQEYDRFILSLSLIGLGLSATNLISLGATAPLKVANSVVKSAKKSRYLSKNFSSVLEQKLKKSVDLKLLKSIDLSSFESIKKSPAIIKKSIYLKPIEPILKDISTISKNSSNIDAIKILKYIDSQKDLKKAAAISKKYKKKTYAIFKVMGKGALRGSKFVIKKTIKYFITIAAILITAIWWIFLFFNFINSAVRRFNH